MDPIMREEMEAAAREIWAYLEGYGDTPMMALKGAVKRPEFWFYMGLGDLILQRRVALQYRQEVCWAIRRPALARAA